MANMTMSMSMIDLYSAVTKHLYCAVCAEWQRRNRFVFSDCLKLLLVSGKSRRLSSSEFQTVGPATEKV